MDVDENIISITKIWFIAGLLHYFVHSLYLPIGFLTQVTVAL